MEEKIIFAVGLVLIVGLSLNVSAFGPGSVYTETNPFSISPGETKILEISLANTGEGDEDRNVAVSLVEGNEIASVGVDSVFLAKGEDKMIPVTISIPDGASLGTTYLVRLSFQSVDVEGSETIGLGISIDYPFTVKVIAQPEEVEGPNITVGLIGIILLVIIIFVLIKVLKKKPGMEEIK